MRKEIIVAIIIGLLLGLIVAYGVRSAQVSLENRQSQAKKNTQTTTATASKDNPAHTLFITSPEPNSVIDTDSVTIVGTTTPNSVLSIINDTDFVTAMADTTGNFTGTIELVGGVNTIALKSYNDHGEVAETSFMLIFSTADMTASASATESKDD